MGVIEILRHLHNMFIIQLDDLKGGAYMSIQIGQLITLLGYS